MQQELSFATRTNFKKINFLVFAAHFFLLSLILLSPFQKPVVPPKKLIVRTVKLQDMEVTSGMEVSSAELHQAQPPQEEPVVIPDEPIQSEPTELPEEVHERKAPPQAGG